MKKTILTVSQLAVLVGLLGIGSAGFSSCKKKEDDIPPAPSAAPTPAPTPTPVAITTEEDAAAPIEDAAPDVKKTGVGKPADVAGLRACCTALEQNAASMPPPNNGFALQAAALCKSMVSALAAGATTKAGALGSIGGMMKGANLPPACK
jgi:hypothetical protein